MQVVVGEATLKHLIRINANTDLYTMEDLLNVANAAEEETFAAVA
jgi:hypothetical protein